MRYIEEKRRKQFVTDPLIETLILDLLQWLRNGERSYEEVMDAWRTSCPRLPVWEDAKDRGLITSEHVNGREIVRATALGQALLGPTRAGSKI
jgi:hypothetical protein